jgi:outer membrane protein TolC
MSSPAARRILPALSLVLALVAPLPARAADPSGRDSAAAPSRAGPPARRVSLGEVVALASGSSVPVALADQRTREAGGRLTQARGPLLPGLTASASEVNRTFNITTLGIDIPSVPGVPPTPDLVGPIDNVDARLRVTQTVWDAASWKRWRAAGAGLESSRADRTAVAEAAAQTAALAYLRLVRAIALVQARRADAELAGELLSLAESQQKAGVSPAIDVTRARTQRAAARVAVLLAENQLDRGQIELARALGVDPRTRFEPADSLSEALATSTAPAEAGAATAFALERRADLKAEQARRRKANADRSAVAAERLPRLDVAADYGASGRHTSDAIATREVSVAVTVPILDGLRREGRITELDAQAREAEVRERDLRDQVAAEVETALLDLENGLQQVGLAGERLALAEEELGQARERFENGVAGNIEVINAQSSLIRARDADIDARFATAVARVNLARATGVVATVR